MSAQYTLMTPLVAIAAVAHCNFWDVVELIDCWPRSNAVDVLTLWPPDVWIPILATTVTRYLAPTTNPEIGISPLSLPSVDVEVITKDVPEIATDAPTPVIPDKLENPFEYADNSLPKVNPLLLSSNKPTACSIDVTGVVPVESWYNVVLGYALKKSLFTSVIRWYVDTVEPRCNCAP